MAHFYHPQLLKKNLVKADIKQLSPKKNWEVSMKIGGIQAISAPDVLPQPPPPMFFRVKWWIFSQRGSEGSGNKILKNGFFLLGLKYIVRTCFEVLLKTSLSFNSRKLDWVMCSVHFLWGHWISPVNGEWESEMWSSVLWPQGIANTFASLTFHGMRRKISLKHVEINR